MNPLNSYTPTEVSKMLGVKPSTVYAWISRKEIQANRVGSRRYISPQQINDFYQRRTTGEYIDMTYAPKPRERI